jgi:murein DD-endopeptidase MepM/ murein hydrolase activator NlpD
MHRTHLMLFGLLAALTTGFFALSPSNLLVERGDQDRLGDIAIERILDDVERDSIALADLRLRHDAASAAQGRMLARMQARLLRMEAFGSRMVEAASLDADEFDFSGLPAVGGPQNPPDELTDPIPGSGTYTDFRGEIGSEMEALANRLRLREAEFEILENVLASRELHEEQLPSGLPVIRGWVSSPFGNRVDPIHGRKAFHAGIDFVGKAGSAVVAAGAGVVTYAGKKDEYGLTVEIRHGEELLTRYGHHSELKVLVGDIVRRGDTVGLMGSTGRATGYHVHFEVEKSGKQIDPQKFLNRSRT